MAGKSWMTYLNKGNGAVMGDYNPHNHVLRFPSESINFCFGNGHGLPLGSTLALSGKPKGGKSLLINGTIGLLHKEDPDAFAIKFDPEFREELQLTPAKKKMWGIDDSRYKAYSTNLPGDIFDFIENDVAAMCQEGMPLKLVAIDSVNSILGRRAQTDESVNDQQRGDEAQTLGVGFKRILAVQRKYRFAVIFTCQVRAEQDANKVKATHSDIKMALPWSLQHSAEYWIMMEANKTLKGREDLVGNKFVNSDLTDMVDNEEQLGHKVRAKMVDSSCGPKGRTGELTLDYDRGIVNTHEEAFTLGVNRGVIEKPNNLTYKFGEQKWTGKPATLEALKNDPALCGAIIKEVFARDVPGIYDDEASQTDED